MKIFIPDISKVLKLDNIYYLRYNFVKTSDGYEADETPISLKTPTYESILQAFINIKYSDKEIISILYNKINNISDARINEYDSWCNYCEDAVNSLFPIDTLDKKINYKLNEITKYDSSSSVNSFIYNNKEYWLDKATRVGLMNSTTILKTAGEETTTLWLGDTHVTLPVDDVINMLSALEVYALDCYNVTARHKYEVSQLTTIEEIEAYDITEGYPEKLIW